MAKSEKRDKNAPQQETKEGFEVPVPKRGDFIRDLEKAAEKPPPEKKSRRGKGRKKD